MTVSRTTSDTKHVDVVPLDSLKPVETMQLYQQISLLLANQVRSGKWRPGQRLPSERDLARSLNVSRPSLREALAALQLGGVLTTRQGAATRISEDAPEIVGGVEGPFMSNELDDVSLVALLEVREALESSTAALAASRFRPDPELEGYLAVTVGSSAGRRVDLAAWGEADRLFHRRIATHTGNPVLVRFADYVSTVMDQPLWRELRDDMLSVPGRLESSANEHQRILDSLKRGQSAASAAHAQEHIREVRTYMGLDPN